MPGAVQKDRAAPQQQRSVAVSTLIVNAGSSSTRLSLHQVSPDRTECLGRARLENGEMDDLSSVTDALRDFLENFDTTHIDIVGHRVVHGGMRLTETCWLTSEIESAIDDLTVLAPLHNSRAIVWMRACRAVLGRKVRQAVAFDTGFFAALPEIARTYALPRTLTEAHAVRRFGFHGLAHQSMVREWDRIEPRQRGGRLITLQLGSGCSAAAVRGGCPVDTSMGFTPIEGLVMATRSGDVDPGLLLFLGQHAGISIAHLERILNNGSGLLGLSGTSADMRELLTSDDEGSALAVDLYCYRVRKYIGAYLAAMNGADAILFGGGVGENAPEVRARILTDLDQLGIVLDDNVNRQTVGRFGRISGPSSSVAVWVTPVDEEMILIKEIMDLYARDGQQAH